MVLVAMALVPAVSANHRTLRQTQEYVLSSDSLLGEFFCDPLGNDLAVGVVCFDLTGKEGEVDISISDVVQRELRLLEGAVNGASGVDTAQFGFVSAYYEFQDAGDNALASGLFCGNTVIHAVPQDAVQLVVWLDGPLFGNTAFSPCADLVDFGNFPPVEADNPRPHIFSGATKGEVILNVEVDP